MRNKSNIKELYKFYHRMIKDGYSKADIETIENIISMNESSIFEDTDGSPSIGVGMGNVVSSQPSSYAGALNGPSWSDGGGTLGSGDVSIPYNSSSTNKLSQNISMGKSHGAMTGKKSRTKKLDIKSIRNMLKKNKSTSDTSIPSVKKVMNFDDFAKDNINNVTKVKEGKTYNSTKSLKDKTVGKGGLKLTDRISTFQNKVESHVYGLGAKIKQVGSDFEVNYGGECILQIMFRDDFIGIKKLGSKFTDKYNYTELGKIKSEITDSIKNKNYKTK